MSNRKSFLKYEHFDSILAHDCVSDLMTTPPLTLHEDSTMAEAKALMRDHRISGVPIVDEIGTLMGLISIENLIIALEKGKMDDPIKKHMIIDTVCLTEDMTITTVIEYLMTYDYGRYPVLDQDDKVVGIVTNGDLVQHILERLGTVYLHNKRREETLAPSRYILTGECQTDECFSFDIDTTDLDLAGQASTQFKKHLVAHGLPSDVIRRASIALYEAEVNVVLHGGGNGEIRTYLKDDILFIIVSDTGPGIENIELAMQPGYTTASDSVRERGFGAGMGLANIKKYSDKLVVLSSEVGVKIEMVFVVEDSQTPDLDPPKEGDTG
jgi:CBS domain-containing protein